MIYRTKVCVRSLGLALALLLVANMSWAADPYPTRPIRWVVPWPAGGVADTQARIIADQLGKALGQQVMIDNRAGASGVIGADAVARSKPDGYTLLYVSPTSKLSRRRSAWRSATTRRKTSRPSPSSCAVPLC